MTERPVGVDIDLGASRSSRPLPLNGLHREEFLETESASLAPVPDFL